MDTGCTREGRFIVYFGVQIHRCGFVGLNDDRHVWFAQEQSLYNATHTVAADFVAAVNDFSLVCDCD